MNNSDITSTALDNSNTSAALRALGIIALYLTMSTIGVFVGGTIGDAMVPPDPNAYMFDFSGLLEGAFIGLITGNVIAALIASYTKR